MTNEEFKALEERVDRLKMSNGYRYCRLDVAGILLELTNEGYDLRTLQAVSDRLEHSLEMREATEWSLPEEIVKP